MKIICMYLPQFHEIKENNEWWGEGYTEWSAVRRAKPLFNKHRQPNVPLNSNYYDLSNPSAETWKWQAELANEHNIYGFCVYHYWFKGKQLLQKPLEILLENPEIKINYSICWANESWTRTWYGNEKEILVKQEYGNQEDWEKHFYYLLKFFNDERYIKVNNKPILNIYKSKDVDKLDEMLECWRSLALKHGFGGLYIVVSNNHSKLEKRDSLVDAYYNFEPGYTLKHKLNFFQKFNYTFNVFIRRLNNKIFKNRLLVEHVIDAKKLSKMTSKAIETTQKPVFRGAFVKWDNTPRVGYKGIVYKNTTPELFYLNLLNIKKSISDRDLNFVYLNAWNEWGEGCYLEPDTFYKNQYLQVIKKLVNE